MYIVVFVNLSQKKSTTQGLAHLNISDCSFLIQGIKSILHTEEGVTEKSVHFIPLVLNLDTEE